MAMRKGNRKPKSPARRTSNRRTSPLLGYRYPLIVAAIAAPLFAVYSYPYAENGAMAAGIQSYLAGYAMLAGAVISILDPHVVVTGNRIDGRMFSMAIIKTCDAMEVNILLAAALAGFPMPLLRRFVTVVAAVLSLIVINVLRLGMLYWLGAHAPAWFDRVHEVLAPLFMVACALAIFLIATSRIGRGGSAHTANADAASC